VTAARPDKSAADKSAADKSAAETAANARPAPPRVAVALSPAGRLALVEADDGAALEAPRARKLVAAFAAGSGAGLLHLGGTEVGTALPPDLAYWRDVAARQLAALCARGTEGGAALAPVALDDATAQAFADATPPMRGGEYVDAARVRALWDELDAARRTAWAAHGGTVEAFLHGMHPAWNVVGRVHVHLAENRRDPATPFAFLATYTTRLSARGTPQHVPLGRALDEYAGAAQRPALLALLGPLQQAAAACPWLKDLVASGDVYHPLRWTAPEALRFLRDVPALETAGLVVRMPATWRLGRPPRAQVTASVGGRPPSGLGAAAIVDFSVAVTLDGEALTPAEVRTLLGATEGLALLRGRWVEVDRERLKATLARFQAVERTAATEGLSFADAARLLAGATTPAGEADGEAARTWGEVVAGDWLATTLKGLRSPEALAAVTPGAALRGTLRPYQEVGLRWLHLLSGLGLGACLADDMGLGKTIQVLALLLVRKQERRGRGAPSLLVAPASLLANWAAEAAKFAPSLDVFVAHASTTPADDLTSATPATLATHDLVVTSYGQVRRLPALAATTWDLVVLDEAQAIKNPGAQQTRAIKALKGRARIALTGTPVENRLGDLWSLFDFVNPGLLGTTTEFTAFTRRLATRAHDAYAPLRDLVRPYILRRMKTDRRVIADLPDKTEVSAWCALSRKQVALYQQAVDDLREALAEAQEGIARRGLVLASLVRLKQVCNHPSQWLADGGWAEADSGKWARLREIAEVVASRQEKLLLFTQFREITEPLAAFLGAVFGRAGLVLHGGTPVAERRKRVTAFQADEHVPFFVLSLKAGGTGLNLTAAAHVVHFDRWWNPAVENQATDRAFRIGQTRNVLVHKFVCRGTVEEQIDALIASKRALARDVLEGGAETLLTELSDAALLKLVTLDVRRAAQEVGP